MVFGPENPIIWILGPLGPLRSLDYSSCKHPFVNSVREVALAAWGLWGDSEGLACDFEGGMNFGLRVSDI